VRRDHQLRPGDFARPTREGEEGALGVGNANKQRDTGEEGMAFLASSGPATPMAVLFAALSVATGAFAFDETKYPDFSGVWRKPVGIGNQWDQTKPLGRAQEPPFTPEYQARQVLRTRRLADRATTHRRAACRSPCRAS